MDQKIWDAMSNKEKYGFLSKHKPVVHNQTGLNPKAKVGDHDNMMITVHWVTRGGVTTTNRFVDAAKALKADKSYMKELLAG